MGRLVTGVIRRVNPARVTSTLRGAAAAGTLLGVFSCSRAPTFLPVACTTTYGGEVTTTSVPLSHEPYTAPGMQIAKRFEFRPVLTEDAAGARLLSVLTFGLGKQAQRTLVHQLKIVLPGIGSPPTEARYGFTGRQFVYDENARELSYWCGYQGP